MHYDFVFREQLFPTIYKTIFKNTEDSNKALDALIRECNLRAVSIYELVLMGMNGEYQFPDFILDNYDRFRLGVDYLIDGNNEEFLERRVSPELRKKAKDRALSSVKDRLNSML